MSITSSDHLFQLVHSLSKSEKRHFKLYASRSAQSDEKKFIRLFDLIEKQKSYDEKKILQKAKEIKPKQLHNLKANLQKQLLQSLKLFNSSSVDVQIRNMIDYSQLLFNKGLYEQAAKMLEKAKKMAVANDRSILLLDIIEQEKTVIPHTVSAHNEERVNRIIDETKAVASSIANLNNFSNLYARLNSFYVRTGFIRNKRDHDVVRKFFFSSLPSFDESRLSFNEKLYLYSSFVSYYFFVQDFKKSYAYAVRFVKLFESQPERIRQKPEHYIKGLNNLLVAENKLFLFREFEETYKKLLRFHSAGMPMNENLQILLFKYKYMHKINHYFMMGDFTGGTKIITVAENELDRFASRMDKHYVLIFYYKVACLYFGAGNFKRALLWLNKIINSKDVYLREDILSFARILNLVCHYEQGNIEHVEYHIRSTYRFLMKKEGLYKYHRYILEFLKNLSREMQGKKLIRQFAQLKNDLLPLEDHPYEKRPFLYFDIISWLESKILNKPVEEIVQEKFRERMKATSK